MSDKEKAAFDQNMALLADTFPPTHRRLYLNYIKEGFTADEAFTLLKVYIFSTNVTMRYTG